MRIGGNFLVIENVDSLRRAQVRRQAVFARKLPESFIAKDYRTELSSPVITPQTPSDAPMINRHNPNFTWEDYREEEKARAEIQPLNNALGLVRNFPSAYAGSWRRSSRVDVYSTSTPEVAANLNDIATAISNRDFNAVTATSSMVNSIKQAQPSSFRAADEFLSREGLESLVAQ